MKKKVLSIIIAAIVVVAVVAGGCYMYISKNAIKNDMAQANELTTQGNYTAALNEYGVVLNKDSNNVEAKNMENIINGYLTAKNEYGLGEYDAAMTAINGIKDYTGHSNLTENINNLKLEIEKQMNTAKETTANKESSVATSGTSNTTTVNTGTSKKVSTDGTSVNVNTANTAQTTTTTNKEATQNSTNTVPVAKTQNTQTRNSNTSNVSDTSTTTSTNELAGTKQEYLDELNATKEKLNNYISGQSQTAMNAQSYEIYNIWNNKLNEIWGTLEQKLPASEMSQLRASENQWIKDKEAKEASIKAQYQGGSVMPLEVNMELASLTEQRCYYLVNNYM
ncbi:MAG: lysozyme inhibitor LprI family protein [Clostridium sp.]